MQEDFMSPPIQVAVAKTITAPPEQVFDAWLSAKMIGRFMFGPGVRDEEIVRLRTDAVVDGTFSFVVRRQGQEIDHIGRYLAIDRPRHLAFTWGVAPETSESSRVRIDLQSILEGTELTLVHELAPAWADYVDRVRAAWTKMLDMLEVTLQLPADTSLEKAPQ
jgi:uncharacterized protein YndB with AHSA1/START domain